MNVNENLCVLDGLSVGYARYAQSYHHCPFRPTIPSRSKYTRCVELRFCVAGINSTVGLLAEKAPSRTAGTHRTSPIPIQTTHYLHGSEYKKKHVPLPVYAPCQNVRCAGKFGSLGSKLGRGRGHHSCNHIALHRTQHKHPVTTDCVRTTITNHTWDIFCWSSATFCQIRYTTMRFTTKKTTLADARNGIFRISRNLLEHTADESSFHTSSRVIQLFQIYYFTNRIRRRSRSQHIWQHDHANHHSHDH